LSHERRFAERAVEDADQGDADLHRREEAARVFVQLDGAGGAAVAIVRHLVQAHALGLHDGEFGQGKHPVQQDQGEDDDDIGHALL
jgi:hypothetical protein